MLLSLTSSGVTVGALLLLAPTLAVPQQPLPASPTPARALLVLSKADQTLAIVDPTTLVVVARVPVGPDPHEVIATPDGRTAYVSNYGFGAYHTLTPVDLVRQQALPAVDLGALTGPHGLAVAGGKIWFTAEGAKVIGRYDLRRTPWTGCSARGRTARTCSSYPETASAC
jgi:DNA-binding beta-propeller fold protein YncE